MFEILADRSVIYLSGADSRKFLQGLTTNNIIEKTHSYNYLLNNQGRYLYDFFVYLETEESYFIDIHESLASDLTKHLSMYKLRSNVTVEDVSSLYKIVYSDDELKNSLFSMQDPRYKELGFRNLVKPENINALGSETTDLYLKDKYNFAIIDGHIDLLKEKSIPIEFGADELGAIDFKKGCYVGQEVMSRAKYQGEIRKKIYKIESSKIFDNLEQNAEIMDLNGDKVGKLCSFYKNHAIAQLREEKYLGLKEKKVIINGYVCDVTVPPWR